MYLTDTECKALKPKSKPYKKADGSGMYLEISPNGSKYWRFRYRWHKKQKLLALGVYPTVTLKEAREKREIARKQLASGNDPSMIKRELRIQQLEELQNTFELVAREWH